MFRIVVMQGTTVVWEWSGADVAKYRRKLNRVMRRHEVDQEVGILGVSPEGQKLFHFERRPWCPLP